MSKTKEPGRGDLISVLRKSENRLVYLTENDWTLMIDRAKRVKFPRGATLIQQGKQIKVVYVLASGKAKIEVSQSAIAQIGPGEICGDMAFLENGVASADVTAQEDAEAYAIEWSALENLFELFPHMASRFYRSVAVSLSRRLRDQISSSWTRA
jgi:CRP-like cAMP-binding protein